MFKILLSISLNKLAKHKTYTFLSVASLAIGFACFAVLSVYLSSELSYDKHNLQHDKIYRLISRYSTQSTALTAEGLGIFLTEEFPELGDPVRFRRSNQNKIWQDSVAIEWDNVFGADQSVFDIFTHEVLYGDPTSALVEPYSIAISESVSNSYFGEQNPIGEILTTESGEFEVTLVFGNLPESSHLRYDALIPYEIFGLLNPNFAPENYHRNLWQPAAYTYLLVSDSFGESEFPGLFEQFYQEYMSEVGERIGSDYRAELQKLSEIHLGEALPSDLPVGNASYLYGFIAIALFVLIVAGINFSNLSVAQVSTRTREIGMQKILGAKSGYIAAQFFTETFLISICALIAGMGMAQLALLTPYIQALVAKQDLFALLNTGEIRLAMIGSSVVLGLVAGIYPLIVLLKSSKAPTYREDVSSWASGSSIRVLLVFLQVSISLAVIGAAWTMRSQIDFVNDLNLNFDKEDRVVVSLRGADIIEDMPSIRSELESYPYIQSVTTADRPPGTWTGENLLPVESQAGAFERTLVSIAAINPNFVGATGIAVVEGREFVDDSENDRVQSALVNQSLVDQMQWENPLGKRIQFGRNSVREVVGVVDDFNYAPLYNPISPQVLIPYQDRFLPSPLLRSLIRRTAIIHIAPGSREQAMATIESVMREFDPSIIYEPEMLDSILASQYGQEANLSSLTTIFSGICLFLSVVGLVGTTSFQVRRRAKEIAVRKLVGSPVLNLLYLFYRPIFLLSVVASIPAYFLLVLGLSRWLENFQYTIPISPFVLFASFLAVSVFAFIAVMLPVIHNSRKNLSQVLRYE